MAVFLPMCRVRHLRSLAVALHLFVLLLAGPGGALSVTLADIQISKISDTTIDANGLTLNGTQWGTCINGVAYQRELHTSHMGFQYVAYYDAVRHVCLARRRLPSGAWEIIRFLDYTTTTNDSHNVIGLGICPNDGTIHLAFDHHVHPLHYRKSIAGVASNPETAAWSAASFGAVTSQLGATTITSVTYPVFLQRPDGDLHFMYRSGGSGNGNKMMVDYSAATGTWGTPRQIDSGALDFVDVFGVSHSRNSYPNGFDYGPDGRLHTTFTWREGEWAINHDINYTYSTDRGLTWRNNAGTLLSPRPRIDSPGLAAVSISTRMGLLNDQAQTVDRSNRVHVVMYHATTPSDSTTTPPGVGGDLAALKRYYHFWRDSGGVWNETMLPWIGSRPKLVADPQCNLYLLYGVSGSLKIAAATSGTLWTDWRIIHTETGPFINEILPDRPRWEKEAVLSIFVQQRPSATGAPSPIRMLDFQPTVTPSTVDEWSQFE